MTTQARIELTAVDKTRAALESAKRNMGDLQRSADGLGRILGGLGGVLSVGAIVAFARGAISSASALDDMAEATGATVEGLSKLTDIARIGGQDIGQVETALVRLTKALSGTDDESKGAGAAIKALGLDMDKLRQSSPDKALEQVAQAFAAFEDGAGKTSAALALFGKSGAQLLPLLKDIAEQSDRVASLTKEQAAAAEKLEKNWNALAVSGGNWARSMVADLIPALNQFFALANTKGVGIGAALDVTVMRKGLGLGDKNIQAEIRKQQDELDAMIEEREKSQSPFRPKQTTIDNRRAQLAALRELASQEALSGAGDPYSREGRLPQLPFIPTDSPAGARAARGSAARVAPERFPEGGRFPSLVTGADSEATAALEVMLDRTRQIRDMFDQTPLGREYKAAQLTATIDEWERLGEVSAENAQAMRENVNGFDDLGKAARESLVEVENNVNMARDLGMTFASAFEEAIVGGKKLSDVLRGLAQDILRIVARKAIVEPIATGIAGVLAKVLPFHDGGIVGADGGAPRLLPAMAIANAPRFHDGLRPDEFPAVLQRGEGVFTPAQMRALGAQQSEPISVTVNVATGVQSTVRAEILSLLPSIQRATVAAVADARLRGDNV